MNTVMFDWQPWHRKTSKVVNAIQSLISITIDRNLFNRIFHKNLDNYNLTNNFIFYKKELNSWNELKLVFVFDGFHWYKRRILSIFLFWILTLNLFRYQIINSDTDSDRFDPILGSRHLKSHSAHSLWSICRHLSRIFVILWLIALKS